MAVVIPGKLVYLATPNTASISTTHALSKLPNAYSSKTKNRLLRPHHAMLHEVQHVMTGGEIVFTTVRHPGDLLVTWWIRQCVRRDTRSRKPAQPIIDFIREYPQHKPPYRMDGVMFWHKAERHLRYENLAAELTELLESVGLPPITLDHHNPTNDKGKDWREYYDAATAAVAKEQFGADAEKFGYSFDYLLEGGSASSTE